MRSFSTIGLVLLLSAASVYGQDFREAATKNWHQWRGPNGNGVALAADPPLVWSESQNIKWKVEVPGKGSSTPIVWQNKVFVLTAIETDRKQAAAGGPSQPQVAALPQRPEGGRRGGGGRRGRGGFGGPPPTNFYQFAVICFDRDTGEKIWQKVATEAVPHERGHGTNTFASSSPTTDGNQLFVSFGSRGVFCFDMDGNQQWQRDFGEMRTAARFGEGSSPALFEDTLVVPWDHEGDSFLAALDAKTGEDRWKVPRDEGTTWATPHIVSHGGRTQVITNGRRVRSYDLATGKLIWECGGQASNPIPSPVVEDGRAYCMTGYRGYAIYAIDLDSAGDVSDSDNVAWSTEEAAPYVASPTLYKGQLYFTKSRNGVLLSRDAKTGDLLIDETRLPGIDSIYASLVAAADRIYVTGRGGTTLVLKHGKDFEVLAANKLDEGIDASPVPVGKELFLRGEKHLYCIAKQ